MIKQRWNEMTKFRKRVFALTLATAVVSTSFNVGSFVVNAGTSARGRIIVGFEELPEDIANQTVPIGAKKNDINFPDELEVVLYSEEDESEETTRERKEEKEEATEHVEKLKEETATETKEKEKSTEAPVETATETATEPVTVETGESAGQGAENGNNASKEQGGENSDQAAAPEENNTPDENAGSTENSEPSEVTAPEPEPESGGDEGGSDEGGSDEGSAEESPEGKAYSGFVSAFSDGIKNTFSPVKAFAAEPDEGDGGAEEPEEEKEQEEPEPEAESPSEEIVVKAVGPNEEFGMEEPASEEPSSAKSESAEPASAEPASTEAASEEASEVKEETSEEPTEKAKEKEDGEETDKVSENKKEDEEKADKVKKLPEGERRVLEDVKWKLDRDKSEYGTRFQTVRAGDVFYYVPDIKQYGLKSEVDLPEIKVTVVEEDSVSDNSVSGDAVSENAVSENSVSENKFPAFDQFMIVDGVKVRVTAPEGVFPENATLKVRKIDDAESNAKIEKAVKEDMGLSDNVEVNGEKSSGEDGEDGESTTSGESLRYISFDITITDVSGNEIQPRTENGNANVTFSEAKIINDYIENPAEETQDKLGNGNERSSDGEEGSDGDEDEGEASGDGGRVIIIGEGAGEEEVSAKKSLRIYHFDDELGNMEKPEVYLDEYYGSAEVEAEHFSPWTIGVGGDTPPQEFGDFKVTKCEGAQLYITASTSNPYFYVEVRPEAGSQPDIAITLKDNKTETDNYLIIKGGAPGVDSNISLDNIVVKTPSSGSSGIKITEFNGLTLLLNGYKDNQGSGGGIALPVTENCTGKILFNDVKLKGALQIADSSDITVITKSDSIIEASGSVCSIGAGCSLQFESYDGDNGKTLYLQDLGGGDSIFSFDNTYSSTPKKVVFKSGKYKLTGKYLCTVNSGTGDNLINIDGGFIDGTGITNNPTAYNSNYAKISINGGTHKIKKAFFGGQGDYSNPISYLTITGGSINVEDKTEGANIYDSDYKADSNNEKILHTVRLTDKSGNPIKNALVTRLKVKANGDLSSLKTVDRKYGVNECYTDDDGKLYLWYHGLDSTTMEEKQLYMITANGVDYVWEKDDALGSGAASVKLKFAGFGSPYLATFITPYVYFTDIDLDVSDFLLATDQPLKERLTFTCSDSNKYGKNGTAITGEKIPGVYDRLRDITWTLKDKDGNDITAANVRNNNEDNVSVKLPSAGTYYLTATIDDTKVGGSVYTKTFRIPEFVAVSDVKSSAASITVESGKSYPIKKVSNAQYQLFGATFTATPDNASAIMLGEKWKWTITKPDKSTEDITTQPSYTPSVAGTYTLKASIPKGKTDEGTINTPYEKTFTIICKKAITDNMVTVTSPVNYTGKEVKAAVTVKDGNAVLKEGTDYTLTYSNNINEGKNAKVTVTGKGIYSGAITKTFTIKRLPTGSIAIAGGTYTTLQTKQETAAYVNKVESGTITAKAAASGTVKKTEYYVSNQFYGTESAIKNAVKDTDWKNYSITSKPSLVKNSNNYIYARITDGDGEMVYLSTKNIVEDEDKPSVSINSISLGDTTGTVKVSGKDSLSGISKYYLLVKKKGESAPTVEDVKAKGLVNTNGTFNLTGLTKGTYYTFYAVAEDKAGNLSNGFDNNNSKTAYTRAGAPVIEVEDYSYDVLQGSDVVEDYYPNKPKEITITAKGDTVDSIEYFITDKFYSSKKSLESAAGGPTSSAATSTTGTESRGYSDSKGTATTTTTTTTVNSGVSKWSEYNKDSKPSLKKNMLNYIYARVTYSDGTVVYVSSKGIWEDETKPKVTSVKATPKDKNSEVLVKGKDNESGIKYYYLVAKKATEDAPGKADDVKSAGIRSEDGKYKVESLTPNTKYVLYAVIEDKAENLSEIKKSNFTTKKDSTSANKAGAKGAGAGAGGSGSGGSGSNVDKRTAGAKDTPSGNDSEKGEAVRDGVPYIEDASDGILIGREKTSGWDRIEGEVGKATAPAQVFVNMNGGTEVPADAFKQCEGRDVTYYFDMNDDITWVVNGLSFTDSPKNIDFRVRTDTKNIPSKLINEVADVYPHTELTLEHDGEFGFTAILSLNVGKDNMGMFANLYFYNEDDNSLEFIDSVEVDGSGRASFKFLHASDYTVILRGDALTDKTAGLLTDDIAAGSTSSTTTGPVNVSRITGKVWLIIVSIISFLLCGLILFMPDKKKRRSYARTR